LVIKYIKKCSIHEFFKCEICSQRSKYWYEATPSLPGIANWEKLKCCKDCARREVGHKAKNKWERIHDNKD